MVVIRATAMAMMAATEVAAPEAAAVEATVTTLTAVETTMVMIRRQQQLQQQQRETRVDIGKTLLEILLPQQIRRRPPEAVVVDTVELHA